MWLLHNSSNSQTFLSSQFLDFGKLNSIRYKRAIPELFPNFSKTRVGFFVSSFVAGSMSGASQVLATYARQPKPFLISQISIRPHADPDNCRGRKVQRFISLLIHNFANRRSKGVLQR